VAAKNLIFDKRETDSGKWHGRLIVQKAIIEAKNTPTKPKC
jgi:hypothetical protein